MKKVMLIWIVFLFVVLASSLVYADEVTALRAELASTKAELNKIKYAGVPAIEQQIKPAPADWKDAYGDIANTQVYFNIKSALADIELCKKAIRLLAATITDITNPDDPNSLVSRIAVLEDKVADMPVFETGKIDVGFPYGVVETVYHGAFNCNKALKPDDPKEVAEKHRADMTRFNHGEPSPPLSEMKVGPDN